MEEQQENKPPPSTSKILEKVQDTRALGAQTLEKLSEQSETLDRIHGLNEEHKETLKAAQREVKKLSVRGRISAFFQREKKASNSTITESKYNKDSPVWHDNGKSSGPQLAAETPESGLSAYDPELLAGMTDAQKELLESQDRDLDAISSVLSDLKQISLRTGSEVNSQSKKIDDITTQVDQNSYALRKANIEVNERLR